LVGGVATSALFRTPPPKEKSPEEKKNEMEDVFGEFAKQYEKELQTNPRLAVNKILGVLGCDYYENKDHFIQLLQINSANIFERTDNSVKRGEAILSRLIDLLSADNLGKFVT